jgi:hypothetical protein
MIKALKKLVREATYLNVIKIIVDKPLDNIIHNGENESVSSIISPLSPPLNS